MANLIQRSFTSGEIAPALRSRADLQKYSSGLALCENFIVRSQGGVYSRPGLRFVGEIADSTRRPRLIPFSFNTEQTYILVFEHLKMRVVKDGAFVIAGAGPALFELVTTYTEAELPRLGFTQSADVMTLVHPSHAPANLSRLADDNWTLADISYAPTVSTPALPAGGQATVTNITNANPAVVTTSAAHGFFTDNPVTIEGVAGLTEVNNRAYKINVLTTTTFELVGFDSSTFSAYTSGGTAYRQVLRAIGAGAGSNQKRYSYVVTAVDADGVESLPTVVRSLTTGSLATTAGIRVTWNALAGADYYRVYKDPSNDSGRYGWIGDSSSISFDDYNLAPLTSDAPPSDRTPFTGADNRPAAVNYYQQRQVFANTNNEPQSVYTTQTGNYNSLRTSSPSRADDAVTFTVAGRQVNEIRHIVALDAMILLTSGGEWKVSEGQDQVLTPSTVGVRIQTYNGASWVPPAVINDTVVFVQEKGARVRDLNYSFTNDKYTGNDLSIMSEHLFEGYEVEEMAYAGEPYSILWCVRSDGTLLGLTYQREHQVWGWHHHNTSGTFESVASVSEDGRDAIYVVVKRNIDGADVRYVERMEKRDVSASENVFCVDSGLTYSGAPATVISGLDHLEGEEVIVLADGNVVRDLTVASGAITIPNESSVVHVGLAYTPVIETLGIDITTKEGPHRSKALSVSRVDIDVERSRGGWVGPKLDDGTDNTMYEIKPRFDSDNYDAIALQTRKQEINIQPQWSKGGGLRIEQRDPLPLAILSIIPNVDVGG